MRKPLPPCSRFARALATATLSLGLVATAHAAEPFARGLLFRVDGHGARTSWVFGTIHSDDPRALALPVPVARAFAEARTFAAEIDLSDVDAADFFEMAQFDDGRRLADFFDAGTVDAIRATLGGRAPPEATLARLKPWAVLLALAQRPPVASGSRLTLDASLAAGARARRMSVIGLEQPDEQASALDAIPVATQVALVRYVLRNGDALGREQAAALDAWLDRDLARLAALARGPGASDPATARHFEVLARHVVEDRSALMAHRLFMPLRHGEVFVAVGALHLYGRHGLLALLREQGYRIRRVFRRRVQSRTWNWGAFAGSTCARRSTSRTSSAIRTGSSPAGSRRRSPRSSPSPTR